GRGRAEPTPSNVPRDPPRPTHDEPVSVRHRRGPGGNGHHWALGPGWTTRWIRRANAPGVDARRVNSTLPNRLGAVGCRAPPRPPARGPPGATRTLAEIALAAASTLTNPWSPSTLLLGPRRGAGPHRTGAQRPITRSPRSGIGRQPEATRRPVTARAGRAGPRATNRLWRA